MEKFQPRISTPPNQKDDAKLGQLCRFAPAESRRTPHRAVILSIDLNWSKVGGGGAREGRGVLDVMQELRTQVMTSIIGKVTKIIR